MGHIKMMGAVQPFISGAISKTVNMPQEATVEDIADAYIQAWKLGIKALAIYRDGSKTAQALRTDAQKGKGAVPSQADIDAAVREALAQAPPKRNRMPRERQSITHKFSIGGHEGYITAGMYEDGSVGEIFITDVGKEGSTLRGMMNSFATAISSDRAAPPNGGNGPATAEPQPAAAALTDSPPVMPAKLVGLDLGPAC